MAGIKEISQLTGLSFATVSRVFNDSHLVSPKTKQKVLEVAAQLNYRHNRIAAALRSGKTKTIGIVVPEINNHFFGNVVNSAEEKLSFSGYSSIITQSHESSEIEKSALESLLKLNVDGILISISKNTSDFSFFEEIQNEGTPIVFFDRVPNLENSNSVLLDDYKGGIMATNHLIENGCKNLVHIVGDERTSIFKRRKEGFLSAINSHKNYIQNHHLVELNLNFDQDFELLKHLLKQNPSIDGFFCHGDKFGVYTMNILKILGYDIPKQIKLIGFGNNDYAAYTYPQMSSIDQKDNEMGDLAVEILLENLDKNNVIYSQQMLSPSLIHRGSSYNNH